MVGKTRRFDTARALRGGPRMRLATAGVLLLGAIAWSVGCETSPAEPRRPETSGPGLQAFQGSVYPILRAECGSCHATRPPLIAAPDLSQAYQASKANLDVSAVGSSKLLAKAQDGHCGAPCRGGASELGSALRGWAEREASAPR